MERTKKLKAGIIGAGGYAGAELLRLLLQHPYAVPAAVSGRRDVGRHIEDLYPNFREHGKLQLLTEEETLKECEVIFAALPHGCSEALAKDCLEKGKRFIDLGADFRLESEEAYTRWYGGTFQEKELHKYAVYGLCELHREKIAAAHLVANPGCYPTAIALGLYPALKAKLLSGTHLIIDAKSGVSGAGKEPSAATHFTRVNEGFSSYKAAVHRHTPEIEQMLGEIAQKKLSVSFVPHLLPINRGILATMYLPLQKRMKPEEIYGIYTESFREEKFVRILPPGESADVQFVKYSNYCDISLHVDERNGILIVASCIDNMVKGAAGQAVQNMNIMCGFAEDAGLNMIPPAF